MIIQNGNVYKEDGTFHTENLYIEDEVIAEKTKQNLVIDATGLYVIPGLIDIHLHGCMRHDLCDGLTESLQVMSAYLLKNGITGFCPATMTLEVERIKDILRCAASYRNTTGAKLLGIYLEGPFLSKKYKGAQQERYLHKPDVKLFAELQKEAQGMIKILALAPEEDTDMQLIKALSNSVRLSVAHTAADYDLAKSAFEQGMKQVTHLYNGMEPYHHRSPGVVGAAFDTDDVMVELICDGIHVHPSVVRSTFQMFGGERVLMVSDSMRATGLKDGKYMLGGQEVQVKGEKAVLTDSNVLAGSVSNLMDCMRKAVLEMKIPLETVIKSCTMNPAKALNVYDKTGSLSVGKQADIVILDDMLQIQHVLKDGQLVW